MEAIKKPTIIELASTAQVCDVVMHLLDSGYMVQMPDEVTICTDAPVGWIEDELPDSFPAAHGESMWDLWDHKRKMDKEESI